MGGIPLPQEAEAPMPRRARSERRVMSTADNGLRPVVDPALPPRTAAALRGVLRPARPHGRWKAVAVCGAALAAANLAWPLLGLRLWDLPGGPWFFFAGVLAQAVAVAVGGAAAVRVVPRTSQPAWLRSRPRLWTLFRLSPLPAFVLGILSGLVESPWLPVAAWYTPSALYAAAALWVAAGWTRPQRLTSRHRGRYLVPADFGAREAGLLAGVQRTVDSALEAERTLGTGVSGALAVLRAEEWHIASALHRYRNLRREHLAESADAASERVLAVLDRQHEEQEAAFRALSERVDRILDYGAAVEDALRTHREWEQLERAEAREDRIADLRSRAASDGGADLLRDEELHTRAAARVRDELIDRLMRAGRVLEASAGGGGA